MVKFIRFKNSKIKLVTLKSRKFDFFRINPFAIAKLGKRRLVKKGLINKDETASSIKQNENRFISNSFIIHWDKTRFNDNNIHIGFTISIKSTSKKATQRNLIKRRLKYAFNEVIRDYKIKGYDFLITARPNILNSSYNDILLELKRSINFARHRINESSNLTK